MRYRLGDRRIEAPDSVWIADNATVVGSVRLGEAASVWFGAVIRGDTEQITLGARSNVQDNAVLHADVGVPLTLGDDVTVGHQAMLHGCTVGDGTLVGIGAVILNRAVIGQECLIAAKALIGEGKVIPDGSLVMGAPGKVVRALTEPERQFLRMAARHYVDNAAHYRAHLQPDPAPETGVPVHD